MPASSSKLYSIKLGDGGVTAAFSLKVDDPTTDNYSMRRPGPDWNDGSHARDNIADMAQALGVSSRQIILSRRWAHQNRVMVIDSSSSYIKDERTGTQNPYLPLGDMPGFEHSCDGVITTNEDIVLGIQNADCPMVFLYDPRERIIGAIHCGWKPVARRIIFNAIAVMKSLGSHPANIQAYVGPGAGDEINDFQPDNTIDVFSEYGRQDLLDPQNCYLRHFKQETKDAYRAVLGREPEQAFSNTVLAISAIIEDDLVMCGLNRDNIEVDPRSCLLDRSLHSFRRDGTRNPQNSQHGLSLGLIKFN